MRNLFTQHRAALVLTVNRLLDTPLATLLTVFVIGIALSLPLRASATTSRNSRSVPT